MITNIILINDAHIIIIIIGAISALAADDVMN